MMILILVSQSYKIARLLESVRAAALCLLEEKRKEWDLECSAGRGFVSVSSGVLFPSNFLWFSVHPSLSITLIWLNRAPLTSPHNFSLRSFFCWQFLVVTVGASPYLFNRRFVMWMGLQEAWEIDKLSISPQFEKSVHMSLYYTLMPLVTQYSLCSENIYQHAPQIRYLHHSRDSIPSPARLFN